MWGKEEEKKKEICKRLQILKEKVRNVPLVS